MWIAKEDGSFMQMAVGDYGIQLPFDVDGVTLSANDSIRFTFMDSAGTFVLEKTYDNIQNNSVNLEFTDAESALFRSGVYYYSIDWYQDDLLMCNFIPNGIFKVVHKVEANN